MLRSLRLGFATNSSSAHSIVLHSNPRFLDMLDSDSILDASGCGRDQFTFTDRDNKLAYLIWAHDQRGAIGQSAHETIALIAGIPELAGGRLQEIRQALASFETESLAHGVLCPNNIELPNWFRFIMEAPVALHGYDDNNAPDFMEVTAKDVNAIQMESMRYRQDGDAIIGYDSNTGLKFRWSPTPYTKGTIPELVDLKITDYCAHGCKFCYQGSTTTGQHASWDVLKATMHALAAKGVFEVAVGGGEPVEHPRFGDLIALASKLHITLNFTTYGIDWAREDHPVVQAMKAARWRGGIGVSVHALKDISKVATLRDNLVAAGIWGVQVMAQTVVGATPMRATKAIVETCIETDIPVLMLGYKTTGRGADFAQRKVKNEELGAILTLAKEAVEKPLESNGWGGYDDRAFTLSVDTAFLDVYQDLLNQHAIPTVLHTSPEGKFSMYIDAVEGVAAPSSYGDGSANTPWIPTDLESIFARF